MARNRKRTRDRRSRGADATRPDASRPAQGSPDRNRRDSASALATASEPGGSPASDNGERELAEAQLALGRPELSEVPGDGELEALAESSGPPSIGGHRELSAGTGDAHAPDRGESIWSRLVHFLQGSWRELQRVQWPDRRQVFQATGVVIGFVIVAGVFLGVSDVVAERLVNFILK